MTQAEAHSGEEQLLAEFLGARVVDHASGRLTSECLRNYPRDIYFIGNLRPRPGEPDDPTAPGYLRELLTKLAPFAFGAEFKVRPAAEQVRISFITTWSCYYRVFPTFSQQAAHQLGSAPVRPSGDLSDEAHGEATNSQHIPVASTEEDQDEAGDQTEDASVSDPPVQRAGSHGPRDSMFIRFKKLSCRAEGLVTLTLDSSARWSTDPSHLQHSVDAEMARAASVALSDSQRVRTTQSPDEQIRVRDSALASEATFTAFLRTLQAEVPVEWKLQVHCEAHNDSRGQGQDAVVLIQFVNASPYGQVSPNNEAFVFDVGTTFATDGGAFTPFELDLIPRGFRYDRTLWGRGFNCALEVATIEPLTFATTHAPVHRQPRFMTRIDPPATFAELAKDPLPSLLAILQEMERYRSEWARELRTLTARDEMASVAEFEQDRERFDDEIERFRKGVELIRDNADVRLAFRLLNETFLRAGASADPARHKDRWRIFQVAFIVSQLPGLLALTSDDQGLLRERSMVDIIYFPTGGGKTEAYLGVVTLHCFFDRLRGKTGGVTAWTRFPLRLLTLQQTQRVADVIAIAELVRREQTDPRLSGQGVDGFAVGYFVGQGGSPNELTPPNQNADFVNPDWSQANDPEARQTWKRITRCPACRTTTVSVDFDPILIRLTHKCLNDGCPFPDSQIPVVIVDNEIYRSLPAVIVGTLDKLAGLGNQRKFAMLLGRLDGVCVDHGYYLGKCCQRECRDPKKLQPAALQAVTGPTLFIQDELHLINEGLGTFDGHYETFLQRLLIEFGQNKPLKIIASSATIEAFQRQVAHLYGRPHEAARLFPGLGPTLTRSFYAETLDRPQRIFIGVIPHNKTIFNTMLELIEQCHREIQDLERTPSNSVNPFGGPSQPGTPEWFSLLDNYRTSLTYFLAGRELNSLLTDIVGDVNPNLKRDGFLPLNPIQMTGATSTDDVSRTLEHLEQEGSHLAEPDAILATSMISHGVDVDRLNLMVFYGMPRQNAEYIQASSRVGRSHVGLVFACLHPARERDQSHYAYYSKFHEYLGQLVEPVAINRWSRFSINRTIPGLFMATLLQLLASRPSSVDPNQYYMLDFMKKQITSGAIQAQNFISLLLDAYLVNTPTNSAENAFHDDILLRVPQLLDQIIGAPSGLTFVSDALYPSPMRSLRDVDESIDIELDSDGSIWGRSVTE